MTNEEAMRRNIEQGGGAAFPHNIPSAFSAGAGGGAGVWTGMTLRDYFAGQALAGILGGTYPTPTAEACADYAYSIADAMLVRGQTNSLKSPG